MTRTRLSPLPASVLTAVLDDTSTLPSSNRSDVLGKTPLEEKNLLDFYVPKSRFYKSIQKRIVFLMDLFLDVRVSQAKEAHAYTCKYNVWYILKLLIYLTA
jgi:hypothetical protein